MTQPQRAPLDLLVGALEVHHQLTDLDRQLVLSLPYKLRSLDAQSYLVREGDRPEHCGVLVSGYAFRHKLTGDGARQILSLHIAGDAVDFQHMLLGEADHNVQMLTRGQVAEVPRQAMQELMLSGGNVARAIHIYTLIEASIFREWTVNVGRRDSHSRIAHLLCEFAVRLVAQGLASDECYELPMTQEQLADACGLTPVHVNRVLKTLEKEGLIERDRRVIRFPDWRRLRDAGDFNARYLHLLPESASTIAA